MGEWADACAGEFSNNIDCFIACPAQVLDDHVRIIQGDGIKYESLVEILQYLKENGWSAENIGFGSGGGLLQKHNRYVNRQWNRASRRVGG